MESEKNGNRSERIGPGGGGCWLRFPAGPLLSEGRQDSYEKIFERDLLRVLEHVSRARR